MAKAESQGKAGQGSGPPPAEDSLDFTELGPSKTPGAPRKKRPRAEPVKAERSRSLTVPVLIVTAIVVVVVFVIAAQSSKEVVTTTPGKPSALKKAAPPPKSPKTAAPGAREALPLPAYTAPSSSSPQPSAPAGAHRRAIPAEFRSALLEYASKTGGKAIALALDGDGRFGYGSVSGFPTHEEAIKEALSDCERYKSSAGVQERCKLYAIGDKIVWQ